MVKEIVSIHLGQAGVQLSQSIWELLCLEHSISPSGRTDLRHATNDSYNNYNSYSDMSDEVLTHSDGITAFFNEIAEDRFCPRTLIMDFEPTVVDEVRCGKYRDLFDPERLISGKEDAANNYARGRYTGGHEMCVPALESVRRMVEASDSFQGFMIFHSAGGGTGSGFQALLAEFLTEMFCKKGILDFAIYPALKLCTSVVEPYNVVLNTSASLEHITCEFLADNRAMYKICQDRLGVDQPSFANMNRLLAQAFSAITLSQRSSGALNADFSDFQTNLVPFPRVHFPLIAYAPLVAPANVSHEYLSVQELTRAVFDPANRFVDCLKKYSKYMACCLLYRGDVTPKDINQVIWSLKERKTIEFVEWSPTGIKVGINGSIPTRVPGGDLAPVNRALCMLANTTEISDAWSKLNHKYKLMSDKRAFFHWYLAEGMDHSEFFEAKENLLALERDYQEIELNLDADEDTY